MARIRVRSRTSSDVRRITIVHEERVRVELEPEEGELKGKVVLVASDSVPESAKVLDDQEGIPPGRIVVGEIREPGTISTSNPETGERRIIKEGTTPAAGFVVDEETWIDLRGATSSRWRHIVQLTHAALAKVNGADSIAQSWADQVVVALKMIDVQLDDDRAKLVHGSVKTVFSDAVQTLNLEPDEEASTKLCELVAHDLLGWFGIPGPDGEPIECPAVKSEREAAAIDLIAMNKWIHDFVMAAHLENQKQVNTAAEEKSLAVGN